MVLLQQKSKTFALALGLGGGNYWDAEKLLRKLLLEAGRIGELC